jgi:hypothetical protein
LQQRQVVALDQMEIHVPLGAQSGRGESIANTRFLTSVMGASGWMDSGHSESCENGNKSKNCLTNLESS